MYVWIDLFDTSFSFSYVWIILSVNILFLIQIFFSYSKGYNVFNTVKYLTNWLIALMVSNNKYEGKLYNNNFLELLAFPNRTLS